MLNLYKESMPVISVVLTTYNRATLLSRSIGSVLQQSFKEWELIVVDDGSTDNSFTIIDQYLRKYNNIRLIRQTNRGASLAKNAGIQASTGQYITFLDSDDEYKEDHLIKRVSYMTGHADVDLIHGGIEIVGDPYVKDKNDLNKKIHLDEVVVGGTIFAQRNVFFDLAGFRDLPYSEESDFIERAQKQFVVKRISSRTYIYYRDTPGSITNTILL